MDVVVSARLTSLRRPAGSSPERAGEPGESRPRLRPVERLLILLAVLAPGPYVFWRISDSYRYYMDDLLQFAVAQESGLSWHLLGLDVFQHFAPINRFAHLVLIRVGDFTLTAGQLAAAGLVVALQASLWWLLHELRVPFGRTLLGLVAVGFSITVLDTSVWADASLHILAALVATNLVLAAHVRGLRTGRRFWHAATVVLFSVGTLTQERALFALPLALMVDWFLLGAGEPVAARLRRLRTAIVPLALMTVVAIVVAVYIYVVHAGGTKARPGLGTTVRTGLGALTEGLFPPWLGIRLDELSPLPVQLAILALLFAIAGVLIAIRRRNADPLAFFAASFLLYFGFLVFSPLLTEEVIGPTALRLHNGAYLLVPTVLTVGLLTGRRRETPSGDAVPPARRVWPTAVAAGGSQHSWWWPAASSPGRTGRRSGPPTPTWPRSPRGRRGGRIPRPPSCRWSSRRRSHWRGRSCTAGTSSSSASTSRAGWGSRSPRPRRPRCAGRGPARAAAQGDRPGRNRPGTLWCRADAADGAACRLGGTAVPRAHLPLRRAGERAGHPDVTVSRGPGAEPQLGGPAGGGGAHGGGPAARRPPGGRAARLDRTDRGDLHRGGEHRASGLRPRGQREAWTSTGSDGGTACPARTGD